MIDPDEPATSCSPAASASTRAPTTDAVLSGHRRSHHDASGAPHLRHDHHARHLAGRQPASYYAGTDDGKVWRSTNAGANWTDITAGLPRAGSPASPPTRSRPRRLRRRFRVRDQTNTRPRLSHHQPGDTVDLDLGQPAGRARQRPPRRPGRPADPVSSRPTSGCGCDPNLGVGWVPLGQVPPNTPVVDLWPSTPRDRR